MIMPATGGEHRELYRADCEGERLVALGWCPDSQHLLFVTRRQDPLRCTLWRIGREGGEPEKVGPEMATSISNLSVHPDGRHMVFNNITGDPAEVWVMESFLPGMVAESSN